MSFLCSFDNFLLKNVISFFGNRISKWGSFEKKKAIFDLLSHFLVTREKTQKFFQHISHIGLHTYMYIGGGRGAARGSVAPPLFRLGGMAPPLF